MRRLLINVIVGLVMGLVTLLLSLFVVKCAYAQGPEGEVWLETSTSGPSGELGWYDRVVGIMEPMRNHLVDFATLATALPDEVESTVGPAFFSMAPTGYEPETLSPPAYYYPDSPDQFREIGYVYEQLSTENLDSFSALNYAQWLGVGIALPFQLFRGVFEFVQWLGPLGLFLTWLLVAAAWVGGVYFLHFVVWFVSAVKDVIEAIIDLVAKVKSILSVLGWL